MNIITDIKKTGVILLCLLSLTTSVKGADVPLVASGEPRATLQIGSVASEQEQFAATEIQTFIAQFTGAELDILTNREQTTTPAVIVLGTPESNPTIAGLQANAGLTLAETLGDEGYRLKTIEFGTEILFVITARTPRGVLYGAYGFIEACITALTGLSPVHPEVPVKRSRALLLPFLDETSQPFYPVRAVLEIAEPDWLARHRINMSGGEGGLIGTGIEDGFGTAFKYVDTPAFEALQDEPRTQRLERIETLQHRFNALRQRGIDAYLFMYVTGEPTEALIRQRPDVLGPEVLYGASRNEVSYRPFCWSKPEFHSHNVEEVQPLWMLESDLFVQGVRQLANNPNTIGLSGFTVQGAPEGLGYLDRLVSARLNWDIELDHFQFLHNELVARYGTEAAPLILNALRVNGWNMASYFSDYAGSLSYTVEGTYGSGSAGLATRFWNIIGPGAVKDTLAMPDLETAKTSVNRFTSLLAPQQQAANEMREGSEKADAFDQEATDDLQDAVHLMELWVQFFESRAKLVEAIALGYEPGTESSIRAKLTSAIEFSKSMQPHIRGIKEFVPLFGYSHQTNEAELLNLLNSEAAWLTSFDYQVLRKHEDSFSPEGTPLRISAVHNYPNPLKRKTTFTYLLSVDADEVSIAIYSTSGRRVAVLTELPANEGYNEFLWDARDADGMPLANGVYFYRIRALAGDKRVETLGRLAVLR